MANSVFDYIKNKSAAPDRSIANDDDEDEIGAASSALGEDDDTPYDSLARPSAPAPDLSRGGAAPVAAAPPASLDYSNDPMMKRFESDQGQQMDLLRAKNQAQGYSNVIQGLQGALKGANTPTDNPVFKNMSDQNDSTAKALSDQVGAREKVIEAIAKRQQAQAILAASSDYRNKKLDVDKQKADQSAKHGDALIGAYQARTAATAGNAANRLDNSAVRTASALFKDPNVSKEVTKLNAAHSAQTLIGEIESGNLVDTKSVRNQLTNILTTIELGGGGGQGDRHAMGVDNLYSRVKDALGNLDSGAESTISPAMLKQIKTESQALGDRAATNYKAMTDSTISGADLSGGDPDVDPGKVAALAKQRQKAFLKNAGYDPETGASSRGDAVRSSQSAPGPSAHDQQALEWLKANPSDPAAAKVKAKLAAKGLI